MRNIELYSLLDVHGIKDEDAYFHDFSSANKQGTNHSATQVDGFGGQAIRCVSASTQYVDFGDIGTVRSVAFWILLDTTTEKILQLGSGITIEASNGTVTLTGFTAGNVYVDGIDTATIGSNAWHHVCVVDTSDITADNFEVGRVDTPTYGNITINHIKAFSVSLTADEAEFLARCPLHNVVVSPTRRIWTPLSLNDSGYASHADDPALNLAYSDAVIAFWFRATHPIDAYPRVMSKTYGNWTIFLVNTGANVGKISTRLSAIDIFTVAGTDLRDSIWHHYLISIDRSANAQPYIDGVANGDPVDISGLAATDLSNADIFYLGAQSAVLNLWVGQIALVELFFLGKDGLDPSEAATYAARRFTDPYSTLPKVMPRWLGYENAVYTDTHDGAGSVTGLVVDYWYEFTQGTGGHNLDYGGGVLTTTGVFQATQTTGTISSGDANDHVRRTGLRLDLPLNGNYLDRTSNALDLTEGGTGNQFPPDFVLPTRPQTEFYESLTDESLTKRWVTVSGSFEPIYDSAQLITSLKCLSAGNIFIPIADPLRDRSESAIEISWLMKKAATTAPYLQFIANKPLDRSGSGSQGYYFIMDADEGVGFYRYNAGAYTELFDTDASYISAGQWYRIKFTITKAGVYTGYIDDVLISETSGNNPTGVETTYTNFSYIVLGMGIDDEMTEFQIQRT